MTCSRETRVAGGRRCLVPLCTILALIQIVPFTNGVISECNTDFPGTNVFKADNTFEINFYDEGGFNLPEGTTCYFYLQPDPKSAGVTVVTSKALLAEGDEFSLQDPGRRSTIPASVGGQAEFEADTFPSLPYSDGAPGPIVVVYEVGASASGPRGFVMSGHSGWSGPSGGGGPGGSGSGGSKPDGDRTKDDPSDPNAIDGGAGGLSQDDPLPGTSNNNDTSTSNLWLILGPLLAVVVLLVIVMILFFVYHTKRQTDVLKIQTAEMRMSQEAAARFSNQPGSSERTSLDAYPIQNNTPALLSDPGVSANSAVKTGTVRGAAVIVQPPLKKRSSQPSDPSSTLPDASTQNTTQGSLASNVASLSRPSQPVVDIMIPASEIAVGEEIGRGAFGSVFSGTYRGTEVAIKAIPTGDEKLMSAFSREAEIMIGVRHPNCINMMGLMEEVPGQANMQALVMERAVGTLYDAVIGGQLSLQHSLYLALGVCKGMAYLHGRHLIHRDLKAQNVLLDVTGTPKVSDFGLSRLESSMMDTSVGTPYTMAPEVIKHDPYNLSADVYSFGIILWQLVTGGATPYEDMNAAQVVFQVAVAGTRPAIPDTVRPDLAQLIKECWAQNPDERPTFVAIIPRIQEILAEFPPMSNSFAVSSGFGSGVGASAAAAAILNTHAAQQSDGINITMGSMARTADNSSLPPRSSEASIVDGSSSVSTARADESQTPVHPGIQTVASLNPDDSSTW